MANNYSETNRKLFHLLTLLAPLSYNIFSRNISLTIYGTCLIIDIIVESLRLTFPKLNKMLLKVFNTIYRQNEEENPSAIIWTLTGIFLTGFIFIDKKIVTSALLYIALGNSTAGFISMRHEKIRAKYKNLKDSLACFVVCSLCGIFFLPWQLALIGATTATIVKLLPLPLSNNFWMPLLSGFVLTFFNGLYIT